MSKRRPALETVYTRRELGMWAAYLRREHPEYEESFVQVVIEDPVGATRVIAELAAEVMRARRLADVAYEPLRKLSRAAECLYDIAENISDPQADLPEVPAMPTDAEFDALAAAPQAVPLDKAFVDGLVKKLAGEREE